MNPAKPVQTIRRLCLVLAGFLLAQLVSAQTAGTGMIEGRVLNTASGAYLTNARVTVEGSSVQAFTDQYGQYRLVGVPAGQAKIRVFYTGLADQVIPVTVTAGQASTVDVSLSATAAPAGEVVKLEAFTVASKVEMEAAAVAINEQRFAATVKNVVSTDAFGDITEGNLGDFVKFLPGVTIDYVSPDARTISVRGVPANYTPVTLNGNRIASANSSTAGRTFELEQISINNAGRIEVLKSRSPETAADALGGAINLVPRSSFEQSKPSFSYRAFVSANGDEKELRKTRGPTNEASTKIKGGFDFVYTNPVSKNFGYTLAVLESNIYYPQHRSQANWAPNATAAFGPVADPEHPYLRNYQVQDGPKNNQRKSISGTVDFRLPNRDVVSVGAQWNYYNASFSNRPVNYEVGSNTAPLSFGPDFVNGALGRGAVTLGGSSFRHKYGFTYAADSTYKHNGPVWKIDGGLAFSHATNHYHDSQDGHFNAVTLTLRGLPTTTTYNNLSPTVNFAGIDKGSYLYPTSIKVLDANGVNPIDLSNPSNYNITNVNYNPADSADAFKTARVNAKRDLGFSFPFTLKAGLNVQEETRDIRLDNRGNWNFVGPDGVANTADDNAGLYNLSDPQYSSGPFLFGTPQVPYPDAYRAQILFNQHPEYFRLANDANPIINSATNSKYFREVISAVYLMGDMRLLPGNRLRLSGGVRFERTQDTGYGALINPLAGYIRNAAGQLVLNPDVVARAQAQYKFRGDKREQAYNGYYPSIDASYNVTHNIIGRVAYARSIGRPDLSNIIPSTTLPDLNGTAPYNITTINASLKPTQTNAYDVSLEYYFTKTGVFSVGAFRKDFSNFTGSAAAVPATLDLLNQLGIPDAQSYVNAGASVTTRFNVGSARVTGVEFNYSQVLDLDSLPKWTRDFVVYANGQQMHLEGSTLADFSNFIPASGSWGVKYNRGKFSAQVNWNYRGRQRTTAQSITYQGAAHTDRGFYDYFKPRIYTDVNFNYLFRKQLGLFINARNLTNVAQDAQRYGPTSTSWSRTYRREEFGVQYTLGVKGTF